MSERYYLWVVARLVAAVVIVAWAASYIGTGSGEKQLEKTQDAIKRVRSLRVTETTQLVPGQRVETAWELDCNNKIAHYRWHAVSSDSNNTREALEDQTSVGGQQYNRKTDGEWVPVRYADPNRAADIYCSRIAQGTNPMFPQIDTMIRRGVIQKGDKKVVNGVACREWHITLRSGNQLEHDKLCIGLEDNLPYEMSSDTRGSRASYSDYNGPIQIDVPEAAVQPVSVNTN